MLEVGVPTVGTLIVVSLPPLELHLPLIAARLADVKLRVQLGIHDVVVDAADDCLDNGEIVL